MSDNSLTPLKEERPVSGETADPTVRARKFCVVLDRPASFGATGGGTTYVRAENAEDARKQAEARLVPPFIHAEGWMVSKVFEVAGQDSVGDTTE